MDYPFGHHHGHHRSDDQDRRDPRPLYPPPPPDHHLYPPPPAAPYSSTRDYPPTAHYLPSNARDYPPPAHYPSSNPREYPPPANYPPSTARDGGFSSSVEHVAHESHVVPRDDGGGGGGSRDFHIPHLPHFPGFPHRKEKHQLPRGREVRVFCEAEIEFSLTVRDGAVVLARANAGDEFQHWIQDEKHSTRVKDKEGYPCFALVNKATGQALQHSISATQPVRLTAYKPDEFDLSILWSTSKDFGHGFRTIRMVNNIHLNLDAFNGDKNHGGVRDGTTVVLWEWAKGENQKWKLVPY